MSDPSDILVCFDNTYYMEFPRIISRHVIDWSILQVTKVQQESVRTQ